MCREIIQRFRRYYHGSRVDRWIRTRRTVDLYYYCISIMIIIFILLISILWVVGINAQVFGHIIIASDEGLKGYTENFSVALKDFAFTIKDYSTVSLTLFGFTLLGDVLFIYRWENTMEERLRRLTAIILGLTSIFYFFSFIFLITLFSYLYPFITIESGGIRFLLNVGVGLLILASAMLVEIILLNIVKLLLFSRFPPNQNDIMFNGS